jgi:hypothetical protein
MAAACLSGNRSESRDAECSLGFLCYFIGTYVYSGSFAWCLKRHVLHTKGIDLLSMPGIPMGDTENGLWKNRNW